MALGAGNCPASGEVELRLEVHLGSDLGAETDGVSENNVNSWRAPCVTGEKMFLLVSCVLRLAKPVLTKLSFEPFFRRNTGFHGRRPQLLGWEPLGK